MKQVPRKSIPKRTFGNRRQKLHNKLLDSAQNTGLFEKYVQTFIRRTSFGFKTNTSHCISNSTRYLEIEERFSTQKPR